MDGPNSMEFLNYMKIFPKIRSTFFLIWVSNGREFVMHFDCNNLFQIFKFFIKLLISEKYSKFDFF